MGFGMTLVALFALSMMALPIGPTTMWPAMTLMLLITFTVFFMRPLYFAPFGEMGLPPRFSGSVIAIAAFIIYLPTSFAYLLWGVLLDSNEGATGYRYMFALMAMVAVVGWFPRTQPKQTYTQRGRGAHRRENPSYGYRTGTTGRGENPQPADRQIARKALRHFNKIAKFA